MWMGRKPFPVDVDQDVRKGYEARSFEKRTIPKESLTGFEQKQPDEIASPFRRVVHFA
jgi:hypothetical protein